LEAVGYYESKVTGLGAALISEFDMLAGLIGDTPKAWQIVLGPEIRRVPLNRFPLSVIFREKTAGFDVLAIAHDRRRPQYWLNRR